MARQPQPLMTSLGKGAALDPRFVALATQPGLQAAKRLMEEVFDKFDDVDGQFAERFQTKEFDSRTFELFLAAYFASLGDALVSRPKPRRGQPAPDFIVERGGASVAVEATTSSGPADRGPVLTTSIWDAWSISDEVAQQEFPTRIGSPIYDKLKKDYASHPECAGRPFVLAIEAFHDAVSLFVPGTYVARYLYGRRPWSTWENGAFATRFEDLEVHRREDGKTIPSNLFSQPGASKLSAILFTNAGTTAKFNRMGAVAGYLPANVGLLRIGSMYGPPPKVDLLQQPFAYDVRRPPFREGWGDELIVFHNPHASHRLPPGFFPGALEVYIDKNGSIRTRAGRRHVAFSGTTIYTGPHAELPRQLLPLPFLTEFAPLASLPSRRRLQSPLTPYAYCRDSQRRYEYIIGRLSVRTNSWRVDIFTPDCLYPEGLGPFDAPETAHFLAQSHLLDRHAAALGSTFPLPVEIARCTGEVRSEPSPLQEHPGQSTVALAPFCTECQVTGLTSCPGLGSG